LRAVELGRGARKAAFRGNSEKYSKFGEIHGVRCSAYYNLSLSELHYYRFDEQGVLPYKQLQRTLNG